MLINGMSGSFVTRDPPHAGLRTILIRMNTGGYPGPTIRASWGDWIEVTVVNNLEING